MTFAWTEAPGSTSLSSFRNGEQTYAVQQTQVARLGPTAQDKRAACVLLCPAQIGENVEREVMVHRTLYHPHVIQFNEVSVTASPSRTREHP